VQEPGAYLTAHDRVLIPVRFFTEGFGGTVAWNGAEQSVTMRMPGRDQVLKVWVGRSTATVGGKPETLDQPAVLFQDRVFVPTRFLAEGFGAAVEWDGPHLLTWVYMDGVTCSSRLYCGEVK
ncbi:MAG: copper amine oxidase domain protein, partial [Firmicutes bacterium]|nr:copper amine oxidase domain protein [Bacillota bacterium]